MRSTSRPLSYTDIGHGENSIPWWLKNDDIVIGDVGSSHQDYPESWNLPVTGRVDLEAQEISVVDGDRGLAEYAIRLLELDFPGFRIHVFKPAFHNQTGDGRSMPNPWLASGWVLPDGRYASLDRYQDHKSLAASILKKRNKMTAFNAALKAGWVRVGQITIQLPSPTDSAFLLARDHVRETSPMDEAWNIRIEFFDPGHKDTVVSFSVPILEFMEMEGISDLWRYPKQVW